MLCETLAEINGFARALFSEKDLVESANAGAGPAPELDVSDSDEQPDDEEEDGNLDLDALIAEDGEDEDDLPEDDEFDVADDDQDVLAGYATPHCSECQSDS